MTGFFITIHPTPALPTSAVCPSGRTIPTGSAPSPDPPPFPETTAAPPVPKTSFPDGQSQYFVAPHQPPPATLQATSQPRLTAGHSQHQGHLPNFHTINNPLYPEFPPAYSQWHKSSDLPDCESAASVQYSCDV